VFDALDISGLGVAAYVNAHHSSLPTIRETFSGHAGSLEENFYAQGKQVEIGDIGADCAFGEGWLTAWMHGLRVRRICHSFSPICTILDSLEYMQLRRSQDGRY
jgi:hypothetical protein